ncbi:activating transcription factor 7-interacting protein 1 [Diprion similis]|uniref:activating transcription factor 7-interacting protein 1 n=1 Tax=Diprion similis TaxID=362088 RepID=UPI001EF9235D|nr:activating transcription factor 7-interacting protein 1 [Diprion similis]
MISPSCPIIMDATSTASSYNTKERNDHSKLMCNNMENCKDELTENEILEESNQDPEDEDTLSDDSLRLRFSDDEADVSDTVSSIKPAAPCISSEQITSQDTTTGLPNSTKKIPLDATVESTYNSCESAVKTEFLKSNEKNEILDEVHDRSENNKKKMWRGGNRKLHSLNNTIQTNKRPFSGHSFQSRYYPNNSNVHRSDFYFNNHHNFGRPSGFRKHGNHWKKSKGKCVPRSSRQVQKKAVKEEVANFELQLGSKLNVNIKLSPSDQSSALSDSVEQAPLEVDASNSSTNSPEAIPSSDLKSKERLQIPIISNNDTLSIVNDELSKECSHLNLDQVSSNGSGSLENADKIYTNLVTNQNSTSYNCDLSFASDDWLNEHIAPDREHLQATENFSTSSSQDSSDFKRATSSLSLENIESTASSEPKNAITMGDETLAQNNNLDSSDSLKETVKLDMGNKLLEMKSHSDVGADAPGDIQKEVETNSHAYETVEQTNEIGDSLKLPTTDEPNATSSKLWDPEKQSNTEQMLEQQKKESIGTEELVTSEVVNSGEKQEPDNKDDVKNEEEKKDDTSLSNEQEVTEQASEKVVKEAESSEYRNNQCEISAPAKNKRKSSSAKKKTELVERVLRKTKTLKSNEKTVRNQLAHSESNDESGNPDRNSTEKNSSKLKDNPQLEPVLVMKRSLTDTEKENDKACHKKMKIVPDSNSDISVEQLRSQTTVTSPIEELHPSSVEKTNESPKSLCYVRKFFQRDVKGKLTKLKREELEELIIQKLVETLTMRSEIGRLREQARISERNQEATRIRCQQLSKQIKDFDMVLTRNAADRRANNDKPMPPIKINRSVGLQVNFISEQGIQNLRSLSSNNVSKSNVPNPATVNGGNKLAKPENNKNATVPRRGIKIRSPRRIEVTKNVPIPIQPQISTAMPKALVQPKPVDTSPKLSVANNNKEQVLPSAISPQPTAAKMKNIVVNGKISNHTNRQSTLPNTQSTVSSDLIDLTEEEDKNKPISGTISGVLPMVATITSSIGPKVPHTRYQRVVQTALSPNVAITTQAANIGVVQSVSQPTPTALVNNINATRLAYVMQGSSGAGRQLLIAPNPNQVRPVTSTTRGQFANFTYKAGASTLANGTVRVLTTAATTIPPSNPPPAPLPETPHYPHKNGWKLPPPPPSLKISKVTQGIVLSWNMAQSDNYADIASYQLYAYQEIPGTAPNSNLWKKVGDVRALPLPMACTLKEFTPGNNYHFAVRAVDRHSRFGQYSVPRNISL